MTNPDYYVLEEVWTMNAVAYPIIEFSCWVRWLIDAAYVRSEATEPFVAKVIREDATGVILVSVYSPHADTGHRIEGNHVTYLDKERFLWYLSRSEPA